MTELKTLKFHEVQFAYLSKFGHPRVDFGEFNRVVDVDELRKSAIEWINELIGFNEDHTSDAMEECRLNNLAKIDWIKHFFNIEEDYLK